ncbi:MAG: hypothetical protein KBS41_03360 [Oscillospiraceae bacterium]|nr:hypothetical protein [Candidatus Equicaccousia limihippi]
MKRYLLPQDGKFYKANLPSHSTVSDGANTPKEMKDYYKSCGYDILAITDHELLVEHSELSDLNFLMLPGYEYCICENGGVPVYEEYIRTKTIEFNLYPKDPHNQKHIMFNPENVIHGETFRAKTAEHIGPYVKREYSVEFINKFIAQANENGFLVSLNHPCYSFESWDFFKQFSGLFALEIYNQGVFYGYSEYNPQMYDALFKSGMKLNVTASDDNHSTNIYQDRNDIRPWGFTMIKAEELTHRAVIEAMEKGNMYATQGPMIDQLYIEDGKAYISFSDAKTVVMKTNLRMSQVKSADTGQFINEAVFDIPCEVDFIRFTVIDAYGRYADTRFYGLEK